MFAETSCVDDAAFAMLAAISRVAAIRWRGVNRADAGRPSEPSMSCKDKQKCERAADHYGVGAADPIDRRDEKAGDQRCEHPCQGIKCAL